jgi:hypothetical protein
MKIKILSLILSIIIIAGMLPINAAAKMPELPGMPELPELLDLPELPDLPDFELPELPPLDIPELKKNYGDMLEELTEKGFGKYKFGENGEVPFPDVEAPVVPGGSIVDKFKEEFGDKWQEGFEKLQRDSIIPDNIEDFVGRFREDSLEMLEAIKQNNAEEFAKQIEKNLNMESIHHDLEKLKDTVEWVQPPDFSDLPLSERIDKEKYKISTIEEIIDIVPNLAKTLPFGSFIWDVMDIIEESGLPDEIIENLSGEESKKDTVKDSRKNMDDYIKDMVDNIKSGKKMTPEDYNKGLELAKKEIKEFLKKSFTFK